MDPTISLDKTVMRPGLIWGCADVAGATAMSDEIDPPDGAGFRWLHLNLADHRTERWLRRIRLLSAPIERLFLSHEAAQAGLIGGDAIALVLHDFERDFDRTDTGQTGAFHIVAAPGLVLTGRYHPLYTADVLRRRIAAGARLASAADALELLLEALAAGIDERVREISAQLVDAEDELLAGEAAPDTRELVGVRRLCAQLARRLAGMRAVLQRLAGDPELPADLAPAIQRSTRRLSALESDVAAVQAQLRLLRDELDLQAAQRSNANLYFISIMTALMMPATLVTGFFGMNTGGLPLAGSGIGTAGAAVLAVGSSAATYFALRLMGMVRG